MINVKLGASTEKRPAVLKVKVGGGKVTHLSSLIEGVQSPVTLCSREWSKIAPDGSVDGLCKSCDKIWNEMVNLVDLSREVASENRNEVPFRSDQQVLTPDDIILDVEPATLAAFVDDFWSRPVAEPQITQRHSRRQPKRLSRAQRKENRAKTARTNNRSFTDAQLVKAVKAHANRHYEAGGWDVVIECFTDSEIIENFEIVRRGGETIKTPAEAIASFATPVSVWAERQADARNSAF